MNHIEKLMEKINAHIKGIKCFIDMNNKNDVCSLLEPHIEGLTKKRKELQAELSKVSIIEKEIDIIENHSHDIHSGVSAIESFCILIEDAANIDSKFYGIGQLIRSQLTSIEKSHYSIEDSCIKVRDLLDC